MSGNSGAWGVAMWQNNKTSINGEFVPDQEQGISLSGGEEVDEFLPTVPLGCLLVPPEGLGVPPVRSGDVEFAQRDGVQQFGDYYQPRQITLQVSVCNDGCPGCPSARQKVKRLTTEWSRACASATLVLFTDCHQPGATQEEKTYQGPYAVIGRPRIAEVTWMRSNRGCAQVTLRFDADGPGLILMDTDTAGIWTGIQLTSEDAGENMAQDYRLEDVVFNTQDAVATQTNFSSGGPDGGSYLGILIETPNTVSPMSAPLAGSGTDGIPVTAGSDYTVAWWARRNPPESVSSRVDMGWFDAGGSFLSIDTGASQAVGDDWERLTQTFTAPAMAAFARPFLVWSGIAVAGQALDTAQAWMNEGSTAGGPETVEVVGDLCVFPVFRLDGELTAPIQISYGPFSLTYNDDVPVTDRVVIDTRWGRATDQFIDTTQNLSGTFDSPLLPGLNDFSFTTGDPNDSGGVLLEWQNAVISG